MYSKYKLSIFLEAYFLNDDKFGVKKLQFAESQLHIYANRYHPHADIARLDAALGEQSGWEFEVQTAVTESEITRTQLFPFQVQAGAILCDFR